MLSLPIARMFAARPLVRILALALAAGPVNMTAAAAETSPPQFVATQIPPERIDAAIASLDSVAADLMKRSGIPGMAIAVVRGGKTVYAKGFGVRKAGEAAPVDADTVFQIASLSKSLSASVVAQQVGAGVVGWDTPIVRHLPWFRLADPWVTSHVTIADMFSHRSGLPDHAGDDLEDLGYGRRTILERLRLLPLDSFRNTYAYTNYGITAGAEAVAAAAGKSWESLAEEVLYKPLGMTSTSERYADYARRPNRALLHVQVDGRFQAKFTRDADAQSPAGGVSSTVNDLARWMDFVLQDGTFEGRQVVPAAALLPAARAEMISSPSAAMDARPSFYGYGIGVSITSSGRVALDHSGAFSLGASTNYRMLPSQGLGIVILTNAAPTGVAEAIGADFMDRVETGQPTRDWYAAYAPIMTQLNAPAGSLVGKSPPAAPQPAARLGAYAGTYGNAYFGPATISRIDGGLELKLGRSRYRLSHWTGDTFAFHPSAENETLGSQAAISFKMGGKGHARDFTIDYLNELGLGRFVRQ
ncbi:serine hydrolase [Azorhizobium doebereinerae]|uniref:serine hydrolase n=1 Tax=Azorhizobium doebereinerae TaxID=281091 RepID=UPI00041CB54D|nr:serine hydrolase [Azorhizobium doebereinerae]